MSRAPPFPTRRRSPSASNGSHYTQQPASAPGTSSVKPLQISRPGSRPTTPVNSYISASPTSYAPPSTAPLGPSRPQRSELRARADYAGSERASTSSQDPYYRDSISTSRSENNGASYRTTPNTATNGATTATSSRQRPQRIQNPSQDTADVTSPNSLNSALSAFKSAGSRRRQTEDSEEYNYQRERELEIEAEKARQQRIRDRAPGIRRGNTRAGEIDAVLDQVKDGWEFVIDPNFNSVDLALQLLDKSALGKDMESFRRTKNMLSKALKGSVDKHYQAFAASLPHHASLLNHLGIAQTEISSARSALLDAKESLGGKRADLVQLWNRGQTLEEMIKILDQIEHLKTVPDLLETLMSEKRLLQAAILLVRSLKIINKPDMLEIGAVSDLRSYLVGQETALREILIEELQNHLYLKSFWCESRWAAYVPNQRSFPKVDFENDHGPQALDEEPVTPLSPTIQQTRLTRFLNNLGLRPNDPPYDVNDAQHSNSLQGAPSVVSQPSNSSSTAMYLSSNLNPEADSFSYMETLLESLAVLGKLGNALDNIAQRLPSEIFALVETTLGEVEERAEFGRRRSTLAMNNILGETEGAYVLSSGTLISGTSLIGMRGPLLKSSSLRLTALESLAKRVDHEILMDLFWTLYSKLEAVAQGFRVVTEVATRIGSRRDYKDSSGTKPGMLFPLPEIWNHVQAEVRTLINDYLTDEQQGSVTGRNPISSINEILRDGKFNRDRIKPVFRFSDTDSKLTSKALKPHEDGLTRALKDTMPGLAPSTTGDTVQTIFSNAQDDRLLGVDQHHRLLIRPDAFHVTVLFQPTLSYLHRVAEILPSGMEFAQSSSSVLDEFVLKVYLPQLEEKVSELFHNAVAGSEAFQPDPLSVRLSPQPLLKACTHLMALINSLCAMLITSPFHRENYSRLILGVVIQFYQRCSDRYQNLTTAHNNESGRENSVALAAQWAQRSELQPCFNELIRTEVKEEAKLHKLYRQETNIQLQFLGEKQLSKDDLIVSTKNLSALASLHYSVSWFSVELNALKSRPDDTLPLSPNNLEPITGMTPSFPHIPNLPNDTTTDRLSLPLSKEMSLRFQALLKTYDQLSTLILDTLRSELRCRTIFYLTSAMRHGTYDSTYEAVEPDPHVVDLTTELVQCNESMITSLPEAQRRYVFAGLGQLMEHILIKGARQLRRPNAFGIKKMKRNILALQQSIKALTDDPEDARFEHVQQYFNLFFITPQEMLDGIRKEQKFTFDEYQTMLSLQCGVDPSNTSESKGAGRDYNYSMYVIDLHGLEMDNSDPSK
ncbi:putative exocyst complex component sec8 [Psilocybe cubensis]|uniref:Exocyst complex component Sec8 n=2 Tax=Psilocybe cubensis TaxID=181762 RepID=A0A8H7YAA7_PSICU|nr:putative exocyst complex component sec8 [Psilocybe cubensis]KAH9486575.1 putative exocyst complex component sec8 [Psilocybe cubensis]